MPSPHLKTKAAGGVTPVPNVIVFGPHGQNHAHYGRVKIGNHWLPISQDSALSRMYFRVTDVTGTVNPESGATSSPTVRFYLDPSVYFDAQNPTPARDPDGGDDGHYAEMREDWKRRKEEFVSQHSQFYTEREEILSAPGAYIRRAQEAAAYRGPLHGEPLLHPTE